MMKSPFFKSLAMLAGVVIGGVQAQAAPDPNFHIYLMLGQSNMEGTAPIQSQDNSTNPRVQVLQSQTCGANAYGTWRPALPTLIRCPRSGGGLGPGDTFGDAMAEGTASNISIGLVGGAYGGAKIEYFLPDCGGDCTPPYGGISGAPNNGTGGYKWVLDLAKKAQEKGVIKGFIFHQGESNNTQQGWPQKVNTYVTALRKDLNLKAEDSPFIAGELGYFFSGGQHNTLVRQIPNVVQNGHFVSAQGLSDMGDGLHFNSAGVRTLGQRYAEKMLQVANLAPKECGTQGGVAVCCSVDADPDGDLMGTENNKMCVVTSATQGWHEPNPADVMAAINVGGSGDAIAIGEIWFEADKFFSGDGTVNSTTDTVAGANGKAIFSTERYGDFSYKIPVENGDYTVELGMVEMYNTAEGARLFDVVIENTTVIAGLDIFKEAGHDKVLMSDVFRVSVVDGSLDIDVNKITDNGTLSSILVRKAPVVVASSSAAVSSSSVPQSSSSVITVVSSSSAAVSSVPAIPMSSAPAASSSSAASTGVALGTLSWQWLCLMLGLLVAARSALVCIKQ